MSEIKIPLSNHDDYAIVDEEDLSLINQYSWFAVEDGNCFYAARSIGNSRFVRMHNDIFGVLGVDHINGNGLDNRRVNLRAATAQQNGQNRGKFAKATSKYKGVCWHKRDKKWTAKIKVGNKRLNLGYFSKEVEAAKKYNETAKLHYGEFARLNEI